MTDLISVSAAARIARACCGVGKPELIEQYLLAGTPAYVVEAELVSAEAAPAPAPAAAAPDATMTELQRVVGLRFAAQAAQAAPTAPK